MGDMQQVRHNMWQKKCGQLFLILAGGGQLRTMFATRLLFGMDGFPKGTTDTVGVTYQAPASVATATVYSSRSQ